MLIDPIDKIARQKQRDVIFVAFDYFSKFFEYENHDEIFPELDYRTWKIRDDLIAWLEQENIPYQFCTSSYDSSYMGAIYLDVPFDHDHPLYQKISQHLEDEQEQPKIKGVIFQYLPLEIAMEYAYQDDPDYDPWADEDEDEDEDEENHKSS